ncbi:MAG: DUF1844 domain-containing protein [Bacteroidota bacterium]
MVGLSMDFNPENMTAEQKEQFLFMMLIQQHQQIAMMGLGKIKNPASDAIERDLSTAQFAIDTLTMLDKYTNGNIPSELKTYLDTTLTNLRLNYADESAKPSTEGSADDQ